MSWANLRAAFPALSPAQLHRLLTQYQLASAMGPMSAWEPGAQDSPAALKSGEASPPAGAQNSGVARGLLDPQVPGSPGGGTGQDTRGGRRPREEARLCPQALGSDRSANVSVVVGFLPTFPMEPCLLSGEGEQAHSAHLMSNFVYSTTASPCPIPVHNSYWKWNPLGESHERTVPLFLRTLTFLTYTSRPLIIFISRKPQGHP